MRTKRFIRLLTAWIQRNERFSLELFDNEIVEFTVIVSGVTKESGLITRLPRNLLS